ncbi:MAG TPA: efflux RND transporter periplasmic adaptor subunit [Xanthobacteraceae bacterium]|jgi:membrane fusion protein (multidrug efflux system)
MFEVERIDRSQERHEPFPTPAPGEGRGPAPEEVVSLHVPPSARPSPARERPDTLPSNKPRRPQPVEPATAPSASGATIRSARQRWTRWFLFALLPLALIGAGYWYVSGGQVMSTDDAYVEADKVGISTDVSGIVNEVDVSENEHVNSGQVLYRLDPRQFQIAVESAKANLAQTALTIESMKDDYQRMLSDVDAEQAKVNLDQVTYDRYAALLRTQSTPKANYDQARFTLDADKNTLQSLRQQAQVQLAKLGGNPNIPVTRHPQYLQAKAQVDEAQRQLDDTIVKAPFSGIVTDVPSIAPGKYLAASTTAFYLVATDHVWVDANPKETELTYVRPGQPVTVTVDTYPGREWHGTVASISPAAAQEFQLLPAQNTSGNWVKVVQRIPMRVRVDTSDQSQPPLRAGMSTEVNVNTGHTRGLPHFLAALFGQTAKRA